MIKVKNQNAKPITKQIHAFVLIFIAGLSPAIGWAQNFSSDASKDPLPWYQVELIIFERRVAPTEAADAEAWPKNIALAYPTNIQYLNDANNSASQSMSEQNSTGISSTITEQPFATLPKEQWALAGSDRAIRRERNLRVLFHEAWRQPMTEQQQAPSIIVSGGDKFDEHYELEGSVAFSVSRYLHINTNLWMTQFESNYGQVIGQWPPLPSLPSKTDGFDGSDLAVDLKINPREPQLKSWGASQPGFNAGYNNDQKDKQNQRDKGLAINNYGYLSQQPFVTKNILTLLQKRRMRSGELHYIDHPRLGILVLVQNYEPKTDQGVLSQ